MTRFVSDVTVSGVDLDEVVVCCLAGVVVVEGGLETRR